MQSTSETFTDFLHELASAINRAISDPDVKLVLIEILAFELANAQYKKRF